MDRPKGLARKIIFGTFLSTIACILVYCVFLPLALAFSPEERKAFWVKMGTVGLLTDAICTWIIYRLYLPIDQAIRDSQGEARAKGEVFRKALSALDGIPTFLLWFGPIAYVTAATVNLGLDFARGAAPQVSVIVSRLVLASAWGFLNGNATARLLNMFLIEAKFSLRIYDIDAVIEARKGKLGTMRQRLLVSGIALFLFLSAFSGASFYIRFEKLVAFAATGAAVEAIRAEAAKSLREGLSILAGLIAIAVALYFVVLAELQAHFNDLLNQVGRMAGGDRNLSKRVNVVSFDDIGRMTSGFNRILDGLSDTFVGVRKITKGVYSSSLAIRGTAGSAKTMASSLARQAAETEIVERERVAELGSAVTAFRAAAESIGAQATSTAEEAHGIEKAAIGIRSMMEAFAASGDEARKAEAAFHALTASAAAGTAGVHRSLEAAREIDAAGARVTGIAAIIADVADKSNLLAMNASIEAAHAGESGKGFAVVAREMKKLAESVSKSAVAISTEVKAVQEVNRRTVSAVEGLGKVFGELSGGIDATGGALNAIAGKAKRNAEAARDDLEVLERLRSFVGEILKSSGNAREAVAAMEAAMERLGSSQKRSSEVNAALTEGVRSIVASFDALDGSLGQALDEVAALEENVNSYKLD